MISDINGQTTSVGVMDGRRCRYRCEAHAVRTTAPTRAWGGDVPHPWRTFPFVLHKYTMLPVTQLPGTEIVLHVQKSHEHMLAKKMLNWHLVQVQGRVHSRWWI